MLLTFQYVNSSQILNLMKSEMKVYIAWIKDVTDLIESYWYFEIKWLMYVCLTSLDLLLLKCHIMYKMKKVFLKLM